MLTRISIITPKYMQPRAGESLWCLFKPWNDLPGEMILVGGKQSIRKRWCIRKKNNKCKNIFFLILSLISPLLYLSVSNFNIITFLRISITTQYNNGLTPSTYLFFSRVRQHFGITIIKNIFVIPELNMLVALLLLDPNGVRNSFQLYILNILWIYILYICI